MKQLSILFSVLISAIVASQVTFASDQNNNDQLVIKNAWIREAPPTMKVLASFMVIHNPSSKEITVNSISSPVFGRIEMHRTIVSEGIAKMVQQEKFSIPAKGSLTLEPGGYHIMLFNPTNPVQAGNKVTLTLKLGSGKTQSIEAVVRKGTGSKDEHHHHHH
jgi:copper(I)-binding protein